MSRKQVPLAEFSTTAHHISGFASLIYEGESSQLALQLSRIGVFEKIDDENFKNGNPANNPRHPDWHTVTDEEIEAFIEVPSNFREQSGHIYFASHENKRFIVSKGIGFLSLQGEIKTPSAKLNRQLKKRLWVPNNALQLHATSEKKAYPGISETLVYKSYIYYI